MRDESLNEGLFSRLDRNRPMRPQPKSLRALTLFSSSIKPAGMAPRPPSFNNRRSLNPRIGISGLGTDNRDPFLHGLGDELRSVVGPDVSENAPQDEEVGQNVDHIDRLERAGHTDRKTFMVNSSSSLSI